MSLIGLYTGYERRLNLVFLVIVLILFGFSGLWAQPFRKATILLRHETTQPAKYLAAKAGISQIGLLRVGLAIISFAAARSAIANGFRAGAKQAGCFVALAKPICDNFVRSKAASETVQNRYVENQELCRDTKSIAGDFGELIKCTVTIIDTGNSGTLPDKVIATNDKAPTKSKAKRHE
jgi:hypothetical protein